MQDLKFPIQLTFKITSLANDFFATDANGRTVAYVRQKMFKLKEDIQVFSDDTRSRQLYSIKADRWLDFSAAYSFSDKNGKEIGKIVRKGWRSMWKAEYEIVDQHGDIQYHVREENGWVKVMDGILGQIPILNFFTGYLFNPKYLVTNMQGKEIVRLSKEQSLVGRKFLINKLGTIDNDDDDRIMLGLMMMILQERQRG